MDIRSQVMQSDNAQNKSMDKFSFTELVSCTGGTTSYEGEDFSVINVKFDSRDQMENVAFIAFVTDKDNGHNYVSIALEKGATVAIVSEDIEVEIPTIKVKDTKKAYQDIATYHRSKFPIKTIGITGSNGKTTVKDMLSKILSVKYKKVLSTEKNFNNELGVPQTLLKLDETYDVAVIEMRMKHKGEICTLANMVKPDLAIVTGTSADVDGFKPEMEMVAALKENGTLLLCSDDEILSKIESNQHEILFCGLQNEDQNLLYATDIKQFWLGSKLGLTFTVHYQRKAYHCELPVLGRHNVQNALLALAVSLKLGIEIDVATHALRLYPYSSMRLETSVIDGVKFIKDYYNTSFESAKSALDTLEELREGQGKNIAIFGDILEFGVDIANYHRKIAAYTIGKVDIVYYVGKHQEEFLARRADAHCFTTKDQLNAALSDLLNKDLASGDTILIKGLRGAKLWEQYEFIRKFLERGSTIPAQAKLLVDVDALKHNYFAIKGYIGEHVKVMPVIKADAYGSGANLLANVYSDCDFFAVADLHEADELHDVMPNAKFLVVYQPFIEEATWIVERDYVITSVSDIDFVIKLNEIAKHANKKLSIHVEIDTGMSRLGVLPADCEAFAKVLAACKYLNVEGIYTHYSSADLNHPEDLAYTAKQTEVFKKAIDVIEKIIGHIQYKHACAGAAIFNPNAEWFNMVRPGYILLGYYPNKEIANKIELRPALKYMTKVTQVKAYEEGVSVSYGRRFVTKKQTLIAQIPIGYSDGLMRQLSNKGAFVIKGQLAPIIGNINMDYTMVDVTNISPDVCAGDEVFIFDNVNMTIEKMAELCDTIGYEIITNIKSKADRIESF